MFNSSVSEQVDPFPSLGDATVTLAVEDLPLGFVAEVTEPFEDSLEGASLVLAEQSLDVFEQEIRGLFRFDEIEERDEDGSASGVSESLSVSCLAVGLAGKSADEEIEVGDVFKTELRDVAIVCVMRKMPGVDGQSVFIYFAVADALPVGRGLPNAKFKAPDAGERAEIAAIVEGIGTGTGTRTRTTTGPAHRFQRVSVTRTMRSRSTSAGLSSGSVKGGDAITRWNVGGVAQAELVNWKEVWWAETAFPAVS